MSILVGLGIGVGLAAFVVWASGRIDAAFESDRDDWWRRRHG